MSGFNLPAFESGVFSFENVDPLYNNPGGIQANQPIAASSGAINAGDNGLAIFPSFAQGVSAFENSPTVQQTIAGNLSVNDFVNTWAPPSAGNPNNTNYVQEITQAMNLPTGAQTASQLAAQTNVSNPSANPGNPFNSNVFEGMPLSPASSVAQTSNIPNAAQAAGNAVTNLPSWLGSLLTGRVAAFILGIVVIAAAVFMLKPTQQILERVAGTASKVP